MIYGVPSYIYDMDKYFGCNVVESLVKEGKKPRVKVKNSFRVGFFIRLGIALTVIGLLCLFAFAPIPAFESVREALAQVFLYDVFGRAGFGTSPLISRLLGA